MLGAFAAGTVLLACALRPAQYGKRVYPPELRDAATDRTSSAMRAMAHDVARLEEWLTPSGDGKSKRDEVFSVLSDIERNAAAIRREPRPYTHPVFDRKIEGFLRDLARAKERVGMDPPDYAAAGELAASCRYCHRRDPAVPEFSLPQGTWMLR